MKGAEEAELALGRVEEIDAEEAELAADPPWPSVMMPEPPPAYPVWSSVLSGSAFARQSIFQYGVGG